MLALKTINHNLTTFRREMALMGTRFEISVVGNDPLWAEKCISEAAIEINRVEKLISAFNDDSCVTEINRNAGVKPVKANAEIFRLIERSLQISGLTDGCFDITYSANDSQDDEPKSPNDKTSLDKTSYENVVLDAKAQTVFLTNRFMRIGFGGNIKGYAADRAKYILQMNGVSGGVINAGGDLIAWGLQPSGEEWTVATADPEQENQPFANVLISNMAFATSVTTVKYTTAIRKDHLSAINPKNGIKMSGIKSVSIIGATAELADSLSAAILSMGINAGLYLINQLNQVACVIIDDHNRVYTSKAAVLNN